MKSYSIASVASKLPWLLTLGLGGGVLGSTFGFTSFLDFDEELDALCTDRELEWTDLEVECTDLEC